MADMHYEIQINAPPEEVYAALTPGKQVVWACLGDHDEWTGTRLTWDISRKDGATLLRFTHGNWRSTSGIFATCNTTWGELMYRLKNYVEGRNPGPRWKA